MRTEQFTFLLTFTDIINAVIFSRTCIHLKTCSKRAKCIVCFRLDLIQLQCSTTLCRSSGLFMHHLVCRTATTMCDYGTDEPRRLVSYRTKIHIVIIETKLPHFIGPK